MAEADSKGGAKMPPWARDALIGIGILLLAVYIALPAISGATCAVIGRGCNVSAVITDGGAGTVGAPAAGVQGSSNLPPGYVPYIPGAPTSPAACAIRGGRDLGWGCTGYH